MKVTALSVIATGLALNTCLAFAQQQQPQHQQPAQLPPVGIVATGGGQGGQTGFFAPGDYNIDKSEASFTQVMSELVRNNNGVKDQDRAYLEAKGKMIGNLLSDLVEKKRAFVDLGQQASTTVNIPLTAYLTQMNDINAAIDKIVIEIQEASMISTANLPSVTMSAGNNNITTGPGSIIDMSKATEPFVKTLERLRGEFNSVQFKTLAHKGAFINISENALAPDLSKVPQMEEGELAQKMLEYKAKSIISPGTQREQQLMADQYIQLTKSYITAVGTEQFLRPRDGNDYTYLSEVYKTLEKFRFMRSYERLKFNQQIGALQPKQYPVMPFKFEGIAKKEMLLPLTNALNMLISQTARTDTDLVEALNNARRFVEFYDRGLTPVLSDNAAQKREDLKKQFMQQHPDLQRLSLFDQWSAKANLGFQEAKASFADNKEIMGKKPILLNEEQKDVNYNNYDTGLMARISGLTTFFTGQTSTVEALLAVFRLVLADIREEVMVSQGDWGSLSSFHNQQFYSSPEQTIRTVKTICDVDTTLSPAARMRASSLTGGKVTCTPPPGGLLGTQNGGNNMMTSFRNLITSFNTVELKRAQDARNLKVLIDQTVNAQAQEGDRGDDSAVMPVPPQQ